jgi:sulfur carrier protein
MTEIPEPTGSEARITIQLNGERRQVPPGRDLPALLRDCGYEPRLVVVEVNGAILPRPLWGDHAIAEGDVLEVVTIVGGGS